MLKLLRLRWLWRVCPCLDCKGRRRLEYGPITVDGSVQVVQSGTWCISNISGAIELPSSNPYEIGVREVIRDIVETMGPNSIGPIEKYRPAPTRPVPSKALLE